MLAVMEACPPELAHLDHPEYGGSVFFNEHGIAGCPQCDWKGVPTVLAGVIQSRCPVCHPVTVAELAMDGKTAVTRTADERQVPRNQPCPCGSGVKAKRCGCAEYHV